MNLVYETGKYEESQYKEIQEPHCFSEDLFRIQGELEALNQDIEQADPLHLEVFSRFLNWRARGTDNPKQWAKEIFSGMEKIPEFQDLVDDTSGDADLSAVATKSMTKAIVDSLQSAFKAQEEKEKADQEGNSEGDSAEAEMARDNIRRKLRSAISQASEDVDDAREVVRLMAGTEDKPVSGEAEKREKSNLIGRLRNNHRLKKLMKIVGRLKRIADRKKQKRSQHGKSEVVGITKGRDLEHLTTSAIVLMKTCPMKFMQDYLNGSLICYELRGHEAEGRGDIAMMIDISGSMSYQDNLGSALAVALAVTLNAEKENRAVYVRFFNWRLTNTVFEKTAENGFIYNGRSVTKTHWMMNLLEIGTAGGTRLGNSLSELIQQNFSKKSDLLIITDGVTEEVGESTIDMICNMQAVDDMRLFAMTINGGNYADNLSKIADHVINLETNLLDSGAECISLM